MERAGSQDFWREALDLNKIFRLSDVRILGSSVWRRDVEARSFVCHASEGQVLSRSLSFRLSGVGTSF
jgi:hypothetical protein